jgi:RimJ/RimL family protein N-acetyltransferase
MKVPALLDNPANVIGIVTLADDAPIGSVAFLDLDSMQRRAELRKLIGVSNARGQGFAEEATTLWIKYGCERLDLEKFYVSTLQTHLRNIRLNESIGFRVEGVLQEEVRIGNNRHDVLRMGLTATRFREHLSGL